MSRCTITLISNAGISLSLGGLRIWVDALHDQQHLGFSTVTAAQWEFLCHSDKLAPPDFILFTHCHPDHYSQALTAEALRRWPSAQLILPEQAFPEQYLLCGQEIAFSARGVDFRFFRLPHEGTEYTDVPHYGMLLSYNEFQVLIPGDCVIASPQLKEYLQDKVVDLALLDFPWVTIRRGREFVRDIIRPEHLLVYHLPFAHDDCVGYRPAAERAVHLLKLPDIRLLWEPFQEECV